MTKRSVTTRNTLDTESLLRETAQKLQTLLQSLTTHAESSGNDDAGEHPAIVKELSRVAEAIAKVCGEIRQHDKHRIRQLAEFSIADIVAYLRTLPKAKQDEAFRTAFEADASEPLL